MTTIEDIKNELREIIGLALRLAYDAGVRRGIREAELCEARHIVCVFEQGMEAQKETARNAMCGRN